MNRLRRPALLGILMKKVNTKDIVEITWSSPKGKFAGAGKEVSEELGRKPQSMDLNERHPFDVEICRIPPGQTPYPYHSHSAQWEFYHVISGKGVVRHQDGITPIEEGDAFLFKPGEPHVITNNSDADLLVYVVADNPIGESCHYPDSNKWVVRSPEHRLMRGEPLDYYDAEE
ncbi:MAG: cupin domain-containing protein [Chthoniobacter sp.]|nr:cupin domain-containing protein [Chthoniobacter sp.]